MRVSLKAKLLIAVALTCILILSAQSAIRAIWILPSLNEMAIKNDKNALNTVASALAQRINQLSNILYDNAAWDEMYTAMSQNNTDWFVSNYFIKESFQYLNIHGWYFYDSQGNFKQGLSTDINFKPFNNLVLSQPHDDVVNNLLITQKTSADTSALVKKWGFTYIQNRPALILTQSIVRSDQTGPSVGTALIWRFIDDDLIGNIDEELNLGLQIHGGSALTKLTSLISQWNFDNDQANIVSHNERLYLGFTDIHDTPIFAISFKERPHPYDDSLIDSSLLVGIGLSICILGILYWFINKFVLKPLNSIVGVVQHVTDSGDFDKTIPYRGNDEMTLLANRLEQLFSLVKTQQKSLQEHNQKLKVMSETDGLTGLYNRRYLDATLAKLASDKETRDNEISVLIIDVDHFKHYNDHYGHAMGDKALIRVAQTLMHNTHLSTDVVCRYGGEEFAIILRDTSHAEAIKVAQNLTRCVHDLQIPHQASSTANVITVSIGLGAKHQGKPFNADQLMKAADDALYKAKEAGRNQVQWE